MDRGQSNTVLLRAAVATSPSLLNGIPFRLTALAGQTSVTDRQTDHATVASVAVAGLADRLTTTTIITTTYIVPGSFIKVI